ncbi:hypothetical protein CMO88_00725 [Candidatus Woesearchaeota archaeon]|nr:hypothetical protein [Candidatus Woesearchaeota archaeon]|tara:strand:- start:3552 stop:3971 length:420 start_codon:yes stop_codon:yes gene_type:complete
MEQPQSVDDRVAEVERLEEERGNWVARGDESVRNAVIFGGVGLTFLGVGITGIANVGETLYAHTFISNEVAMIIGGTIAAGVGGALSVFGMYSAIRGAMAHHRKDELSDSIEALGQSPEYQAGAQSDDQRRYDTDVNPA